MKQSRSQNKFSSFFSNDKRNIWILYITFLLFNVALAVQYRAPFAYPDEYGVFTAGNWMLGGVDWAYKSNMYYGYTFSPFVGILLRLFHTIRPIYIGALCIKALQLSLIPVLIYKLLHEVLEMEDVCAKLLLSSSISLYPSLTLYAKYVSNETTLHVTLFICLYLIGKLAIGAKKNRTRLYSALLGFFAVFAYASHGMGLAFIVAVCLVVIIAHIATKKSLVSYPFFITALASFYFLDIKIKAIVMDTVYYTPESGMTNTFSTGMNSLLNKLPDVGFILSFLNMLISRLLYISSSTFGLFLLSFIILLVFLFRFVKAYFSKSSETQDNTLFIVELFSLMIFLCGIGLSSLHNAPRSLEGTSRMFFYGRYFEYTALPLILIGLYRIFNRSVEKMELLKYFVVSFLCCTILYLYSHFLVIPRVSSSLNQFFILGIVPFISKSTVELSDAGSQNTLYFDLFTLGLVTASAFTAMVYLLRGRRRPWALVLLAGMFLYGTFFGHFNNVLPLSTANYKNFYSNMEPIEAALGEFKDIYDQYPKLYVVTNKLGASTSSASLLRGRAQISFINYSVAQVIMVANLSKVNDPETRFKNAIIVSERDLEELNTDEAYLKIYDSPSARIWIRGDEIREYYANREYATVSKKIDN